MASTILALNISYAHEAPSTRFGILKRRAIKHIKCLQKACNPELTIARKSANYQPPTICDDGFIQSIKTTAYKDIASIDQRVGMLKDYTISLLKLEGADTMVLLELIDTLERLGIDYLFEVEIKRVLEGGVFDLRREGDLHYTALYFRLLRQNGHIVSQDIFRNFMDENGRFRENLSEDTKGILSLYEASFLAVEGESIMDEARAFAIRHLNEFMRINSKTRLYQLVEHALEIPFHWMPPRLEARWFIDAYTKYEEKDSLLLELAKLDYNRVQATAQDNIKSLSRWWNNLGVAESLNFTRERLPESFILAMGGIFQQKYSLARESMTQAAQFVVSLDDMYEHYGIIEELELFTDAVERWDVHAVEQLPECMRLCYLALLNIGNQLAYDTLRLKGRNILPFLKKYWLDLCKSNLKEAKWSSEGYTPTLEEYLENATITIGIPFVFSIAYFQVCHEISEHTVNIMSTYSDLIQQSALIFRLCDDIAESIEESEGGDPPNSLHYYMWEQGTTKEAALEYVRHLVSESWKKMNKYLVLGSPFQKDYIDFAMGLARIGHWFYLTGDGFTSQRQRTLDVFKLMVVDPIPLDK